MGGGAAYQSHTGADLRLEPAVLDNCCNPPPPRLLRRDHGFREMASLPIPNELVAEIFLRLPTPADLVRASAACTSFRAVAAGRSFLWRFRKLHARPLLGFVSQSKVFYPANTPHPSAAALAADFSFAFLSAPASDWVIRDIRDGRVLLHTRSRVHDITIFFSGMVVCDPLHQQFLMLPPITFDLVDSVDDPLWKNNLGRFEVFLVPAGDEAAAADETSFRAIWMVKCKTSLVAFLFSSNTGEWRVISSRRWSDLTVGFLSMPTKISYYLRQYVYGCFYWYWVECRVRRLLVLDTKTMDFSFVELPPEAYGCPDFAMVEAGEGRPGLFVLADSGSDLSYFIRRNNGGSSSQWQKVKTISLGSESSLICNMEKHLLLHQVQSSLLEAGCFRLHIETFQLERVCALDSTFHKLHAYINFPPSLLSSPTISSGYWTQDEHQKLFDLVNLDLRMKAHQIKNPDNRKLRDNISWEAISDKLSTRNHKNCCLKWYDTLASPLVRKGVWADLDDYLLVEALQKDDAICIEDVDLDSLLNHRSGQVCRQRWNQMVHGLGGHREKPFIEQVDVLSKRYCSEMIEYRKDSEETPAGNGNGAKKKRKSKKSEEPGVASAEVKKEKKNKKSKESEEPGSANAEVEKEKKKSKESEELGSANTEVEKEKKKKNKKSKESEEPGAANDEVEKEKKKKKKKSKESEEPVAANAKVEKEKKKKNKSKESEESGAANAEVEKENNKKKTDTQDDEAAPMEAESGKKAKKKKAG